MFDRCRCSSMLEVALWALLWSAVLPSRTLVVHAGDAADAWGLRSRCEQKRRAAQRQHMGLLLRPCPVACVHAADCNLVHVELQRHAPSPTPYQQQPWQQQQRRRCGRAW